jgi:hypothetical protein
MSSDQGWKLIASPGVRNEVERNLSKFPFESTATWVALRSQISLVDDVVSIDRALVFPASKDRPVLITALAWADVLLTLDREDLHQGSWIVLQWSPYSVALGTFDQGAKVWTIALICQPNFAVFAIF